jgi:SsrA-binding protein
MKGTRPGGRDRLLASNRRAEHDYFIHERVEAGLVLTGSEVKSARAGRVQLKGGWVEFRDGEAWLRDVHFSPYAPAARENPPPTRSRKLLLHRREIDRWMGRITERGWTVVPLALWARGDRIKVDLGLAEGKKRHDKREAERRRELDREARAALGGFDEL